jgi:glutathione S-transferase
MPAIIVHHLNNSRSQRILWMLEELGAPYDIVFHARDSQTMLAPPELRAIHPLGKSPVIEDDGLVIAETGAIVEYLASRFGALMPTDPADRRQATYWLHFAEGSAMPPLVMKLQISRMGEAAAAMIPRIDQQIANWLAFLQTELAGREFLAGPTLSVADIMMSFPIEAAMARGGGETFAGVVSYLAGLHARPAYQRALERGGPYRLLR